MSQLSGEANVGHAQGYNFGCPRANFPSKIINDYKHREYWFVRLFVTRVRQLGCESLKARHLVIAHAQRLTAVLNPRRLFSFEYSDVISASANRFIMTQAKPWNIRDGLTHAIGNLFSKKAYTRTGKL